LVSFDSFARLGRSSALEPDRGKGSDLRLALAEHARQITSANAETGEQSELV
jgi:hypothetical protein